MNGKFKHVPNQTNFLVFQMFALKNLIENMQNRIKFIISTMYTIQNYYKVCSNGYCYSTARKKNTFA